MVAAAVGAAATVVGSAISASAAGDASEAQAQAAQNATNAASANAGQVRFDLSPYRESGLTALNALERFSGTTIDPDRLRELTTPYQFRGIIQNGPDGKFRSEDWDPSIAGLEKTPGYQFTRDQGLKALENQFAAKGLGISGNAMRGAADYATGLAQQTYGQEFNRYNSQYQNQLAQMGRYLNQNQDIFNMLQGANSQGFNQLLARAQLGSNAAAQTGSIGTAASGQVQSGMIGVGNAQGAGIAGQGAALGGGIASAGNTMSQYMQANQQRDDLYNRLFGSGTATPPMPQQFMNYSPGFSGMFPDIP